MATNQLNLPTSLADRYAGMLVRNLDPERVVVFAVTTMTLDDLAEITGRSNSYLSAIKRGRRQPTQEMREDIYAWYKEVSEFAIQPEDYNNVVPIYSVDNVREAEQAMREFIANSDILAENFHRSLRRQLRGLRKEAPETPDNQVVTTATTGVLTERAGYTIESTPTGKQHYVQQHPADWYDDEGNLLTMNQRMMRK